MKGSVSFRSRPSLWRAAVALIGVTTATAVVAAAQAKPAMMGGGKSKAQKIHNATAAAPASISSKATIMDWPASEGAMPSLLRQGSNGWVCYPDMPMTKGNDPMCLDEAWQAWMDGYMNKKAPQITHTGVGYMTAPGGAWGSNTDPYASKATPDNEWGYDPPHVMIVAPNPDALKGLPTGRKSGGPWVMWVGTPLAHIMAPVTSMAPAAPKKP